MKILVGIGCKLDVTLLAETARQMPEHEFRFVGTLYSQGWRVRRYGFPYRFLPFSWPGRRRDYTPSTYPTELRGHGAHRKPLPPNVRGACALLDSLLDDEIATFSPDLVLFVDVDSLPTSLLDKKAREAGISRRGLFVLFSNDRIFLMPHGMDFPAWLQKIQISPEHSHPVEYVPRMNGGTPLKTGAGYLEKLRDTACPALERVIRLITFRPSLDSWRKLSMRYVTPFLSQTLDCLGTFSRETRGGRNYVLVLLNHPHTENSDEKWLNLIRFALEAVPEDCLLVLRPHPREANRDPMPDQMRTLLKQRGALVSRDTTIPFDELLRDARAVFTLTSVTGLEAMAKGTATFTLGPAFFARPGMATAVSPEDAPRVRELLSGPTRPTPDVALVHSFMNHLVECYSAQMEGVSGSPRHLAEKIREELAHD